MDLLEPITKSRSSSSIKPRPASTHLESNLDYLRERENLGRPLTQAQQSPHLIPASGPENEISITSNVDFLRSMEDGDPKKKEKTRHFSHHSKRSSLTSLGAGTKNILAGKFGDAFKRFETNSPSGSASQAPPRTPSPTRALDRRDLTPIAGSEATDGRSDDGNVLEETDDMTPEMRREIERRRLSMEEKRVAAAGAEYRQRVGSRLNPGEAPIPLPKSIGGVSRAVSIQNKVQSLLDESNRSAKDVGRTAQGYGPYADAPPQNRDDGRPVVPRKMVGAAATGPRLASAAGGDGIRRSATTAVHTPAQQRGVSAGHSLKPAAPPKPTHLNTIPVVHSGSGAVRPASPPKPSSSINVAKTRAPREQQHLVAVDLPGQPSLEMSAAEREDYIRDFQKRFPSLTSFEMVERDLAAEAGETEVGRAR
jgi:AP2-associated kinase